MSKRLNFKHALRLAFIYFRPSSKLNAVRMKRFVIGGIVVVMLVLSCEKDDDFDAEECNIPNIPDTSLVNLDLNSVPYPKLSDYNLFQGELSDMNPQDDVIPYDILSHLFTDYAQKLRFIWMPDSVSSSYAGDGEILDFPVGTVIIKHFYYDNVQPADERRIIETRLLIRTEQEWLFADYAWNEEQNEGFYDPNGSFTDVDFVDENGISRQINYRIPSETECETCHQVDYQPIPIGPKPQGMNMMMNYSSGAMNQLDKWRALGMMDNSLPSSDEIVSVVDYSDETADLEMRVRSYVDINCSHCHSDGAYCDYRPMRFAFDETGDPENLGVCVTPDDQSIGIDQTHIVSAGAPQNSMLIHRISSTEEAERMPLVGRTIVHEESIQLIEEWISSLSPPCED